MGDTKAIDSMVAVLTDPFGVGHMGITAENLAAKRHYPRTAGRLRRRIKAAAAVAIAEGRFKSQIVPVVKADPEGIEVTFDTDDIKGQHHAGVAGQDKPAFKKDGTVTAGNASGINDGAASFVLAAADVAAAAGHKPIARLVSYAVAGVPNEIMGEGPDPGDQDGFEGRPAAGPDGRHRSNEAFARAGAVGGAKVLELDMAKTNPNGGAIALGHPVGCSGAFIATKALYELQRTGGKYALVTMCIGGGGHRDGVRANQQAAAGIFLARPGQQFWAGPFRESGQGKNNETECGNGNEVQRNRYQPSAWQCAVARIAGEGAC